MPSDRLSPLDTSFLHLEDADHPHARGVRDGLRGHAAPLRRVRRATSASRLHLVPRYRQRSRFVPLGQARPRWVDDERFDLRYHVRNTALPTPGGEHELQVLAGRVFSQQLNRDRPLWEMWLVEGLEATGSRSSRKTHHALVDGVSGLDILSVLFAGAEEARDPGRWVPRPAPSSAELLAEALLERLTSPRSCCGPPGRCCAGPSGWPRAWRRRRWAPARSRGRGSTRAVDPLQRRQVGRRPALRVGARLPRRPQGDQERGWAGPSTTSC